MKGEKEIYKIHVDKRKKEAMKKDGKLLDPTLDPIFKAVFTSETKESKEALRSMVGAFVGSEVRSVTVNANEPVVRGVKEKQVRLDIHCIFEKSNKKNIKKFVVLEH